MKDGDGVPDVPDVVVESPHWKVGDGMSGKNGKPLYVIGQIAVVDKGKDRHGKTRFDVVFFNTKGENEGRKRLVEV